MAVICRICRNTHKKLIPLVSDSNKNSLNDEGEKFEYCLGLKVLEIPNHLGICTVCEQQLNGFYTFKQQAIKSHYYELLLITLEENDDKEIKSESFNYSDIIGLKDVENDKNSLISEAIDEVNTESNDEISNNPDTQEKEFGKIDKTNGSLLGMSLENVDTDFSTENDMSLNQNEEEHFSLEMYNNNSDMDIDSDDDGLNIEMSKSSNEKETIISKNEKPSQNSSETNVKDNSKKSRTKKELTKEKTEIYKCDICIQKFYSKEKLEGHTNEHIGLPAFQCNICGKTYKLENMRYYISHMNGHRGIERPHKCELCPSSFFNKADLNIHMRIHTNERPYICETCGNQFYTMTHLKHHLESHSADNSYICDICNKGFRNRITIRKHNKEVHQPKRFNCNVCDKKFSRKECYENHIIKYHRNLEDKEYQKNENSFVCIACGVEYSDYDTLKAHESRFHHLPRHYYCERCKKIFSQRKLYQMHFPTCEIYSGENECLELNNHNLYECKTCEKKFKRRNYYIDHLQICHHNLSKKKKGKKTRKHIKENPSPSTESKTS